MPSPTLDDVEQQVTNLLDSAVPPARIILIEEHPEYPGNLVFEPLDENSRDLFVTEHQGWVSRYLILNELHLAETFSTLLTESCYYPIWMPSAHRLRQDIARWSEPLEIDGYQLRPFQSFALNRALERVRSGRHPHDRFWFFNWSAGAGKASPLTEPVLTPTGWRTIGELRVGDQVIGSSGQPTTVLAIHPQGIKPVHRVVMNDDTFVRCNAEHLWNVRKYSTRTRRASPSSPSRKERVEEASWKTLTTREIAANTGRRWQLPLLPPVVFADQQPPELDPYTLGVFLGDGCWPQTGTVSVSTDRWIIESLGWEPWSATEAKTHEYHTAATVPGHIREQLKRQGLAAKPSHEKFIPAGYLTASVTDRLALLQGLLDTDGSPDPRKSTVEFCSTSFALCEGVIDLVRGLGGKATLSEGRITQYTTADGNKIPGKESWRVHISMTAAPFRLPRKLERWRCPTKYEPVKTIVSVVDEGVEEEQVCITVEASDGLYVTRGHTVTHNSFCSGAAAKELFGTGDVNLVIACTLSKLKENLRRTFENPAGLRAVVNDGTKAKRRRVYDENHQVYVMNYEKLWHDEDELTALVSGKRVLWVLDEAHKLITDSQPTKARQALDRMTRSCVSTVWPMSATVVGGNPLRFRDVFSLDGHPTLNPLSTKSDFISRYADQVNNIPVRTPSGGHYSFTTYDWSLTRVQEIRHRVGDRTMAVRKTDPGVREQFKGLQTLTVSVQASGPTRQLLDLITDKARAANARGESLTTHYLLARIACINPGALRRSSSPEAAALLEEAPELLQASHSAKLEVLNGLLEDIREAQDKAVVFCHWTELGLLPMAEHITVPHVLHYGTGQSAKDSQAAQDRFKADPDITAFCSSDAGTHGLNLQEARYVINVDPTYSYDDLAQRNARIDRADSHLDGLTAYVLITEDSVEERVWEVCESRRRLASAVQGTTEELSYSTEDHARLDESRNLEWLLFGEDR